MLAKDQREFISQHMKRNKLRVFMTILAAAMGCAFLIIIASVGFGLHKTIQDEVLSNRIVTEIELYGKQDNGQITEEEIDAIREKEHVKTVVERIYVPGNANVTLGGQEGYGELVYTDLAAEQEANLALAAGTIPTASNEVVVGYQFANSFLTEAQIKELETAENYFEEETQLAAGIRDTLIGKEITVAIQDYETEELKETQTFVITGIAKQPSKDWVYDQKIYASTELAAPVLAAFNIEEPNKNITVHATDFQYVGDLSESLKDDGYYVYSVTEELGQMNMLFTAIQIGLVVVGTVAVLIASIGIFNTMTMAVTERTREIGIMKAIGAPPRLIQRLFLMESTMIGLIGTSIAVAVSYGISLLVNWIVPMIVFSSIDEEAPSDMTIIVSYIPWQLVLIAAVISIGVAVLSGWRPARKATQIDVIQALKES